MSDHPRASTGAGERHELRQSRLIHVNDVRVLGPDEPRHPQHGLHSRNPPSPVEHADVAFRDSSTEVPKSAGQRARTGTRNHEFETPGIDGLQEVEERALRSPQEARGLDNQDLCAFQWVRRIV